MFLDCLTNSLLSSLTCILYFNVCGVAIFCICLIFISSDKKNVLPLAVAKWMAQDTIHDWGIMIAASVLIIIPTLVFYLIIQKKLISGMAAGGVKGG